MKLRNVVFDLPWIIDSDGVLTLTSCKELIRVKERMVFSSHTRVGSSPLMVLAVISELRR